MATKEEEKKTLDDLKDLKAETAKADAKEEKATTEKAAETSEAPAEPVLDKQGRAYGTGRRKNAVARVWVKRGKGQIIVNKIDQVEYFKRDTQRLVINQPFLKTNRMNEFDVICTVTGGGLSGQAGAVRHGIARALINFEPDLRPALKKAGMLTRDSRMVERKKIGLHKARRMKQWAKR